MNKFYGKVGFGETQETVPGVWVDEITERNYFGDIIRNTSKQQNSNNLNDNLIFNNQISIVSDPFAYQNFYNIKYIELYNAKWKITSVEVKQPRLILTLGDMYNE